MQKFTTYEEYKDLTKGFRKAHAPLDSNLFLLPDELKSTIAEGRMSYTLTDDALLLYVDEGYYYHLYYFLPLSSELPEIRLDKQVLVEIIYNEKRENETVQALRDKCLRAGARYKKKSRQMEMPLSRMREVLDSDYEAVESRLKSEGISFSFAEKKDLPKIKSLWEQFLDPLDFKYMPLSVMEKMAENNEITTARNEQGEVIAGECIQISGSRSLSYHLAVDIPARGKGLGKAFMYHWFLVTLESSAKIGNAWFAEDNTVSINCHLKAGEFTGKVSEQYVFDAR